MGETKTIGFKIQGEYITEQARIAFYEKLHVQEAIEILTSCIAPDCASEEEIVGIAMKILDGRAGFEGVYPGDFHLEEYDTPDEEFRLSNISKNNPMDEIERLKKENENLLQKLSFALEYADRRGMLRRMKEEYRNEYGERLCESDNDLPSYAEAMLEARVERMKAGSQDDDYGWLEPDGTFHAVPWGDHQEWAAEYLKGLYEKGKIELEMHDLFDAGRVLCEKNWVLIHSPSQGIPFVTSLNVRGMTKAQKEYMYDYYIKRNQHKAANQLYEE